MEGKPGKFDVDHVCRAMHTLTAANYQAPAGTGNLAECTFIGDCNKEVALLRVTS